MTINHEAECDHDLFTVEGAPERSTGWVDGWRAEISDDGYLECFEFFDAEKNQLFACSIVPGSDLDEKIDEVLDARIDTPL